MKGTTILSDLLKVLEVPHTGDYSDERFHTMPFMSLFGFSRLLSDYGIASEGVRLGDKSQMLKLPAPFIAQLGTGFVIVDSITADENGGGVIGYTYYHEHYTKPFDDFLNKFTGVVLLVYPDSTSIEPDYRKHHFSEVAEAVKRWAFALALIFLGAVGFIQSGIGRHLSLIFLLATDIAGLVVCYLLMLKSMRVKSHAADKFCGILQKHGCDTVLEQKASTFYGLFSWSEVGMTYFSVSTLLLLLFPGQAHWLALINGCCLPFTIWSISYQKFVIKAWCTLCVTVQTLLWCQFFCFLLGGWWSGVFPLRLPLFEMGGAYVAVLMGPNAVMKKINKS